MEHYILILLITLVTLYITNFIPQSHTSCYVAPEERKIINKNEECSPFGKYECVSTHEKIQDFTYIFQQDTPGNYRNDIQTICSNQKVCCEKSN